MQKARYTYAIGDVQGCYTFLRALLEKIHYDPMQDRLLFSGDLCNRGPEPLATLRFIKNLPEHTVCVLGNHDLALLAASEHVVKLGTDDTMQEILRAEDKHDLIHWIRTRPLLYHDAHLQCTLTHAGIFPSWDLEKAKMLAKELENLLQSEAYFQFLPHMYGDHPSHWSDTLSGWDRYRFIANAFTRMRFITDTGGLDLRAKGKTHPQYVPWFTVPHRPCQHHNLLFGHWAALEGQCDTPQIYPLDTGCVWGKCLTAFCLETQARFSVDCLFLSE